MAHVLVNKYANHLPLYRQGQILARQGIDVDRSNLALWVGRGASLLAPVVHRMLELLKVPGEELGDAVDRVICDDGKDVAQVDR